MEAPLWTWVINGVRLLQGPGSKRSTCHCTHSQWVCPSLTEGHSPAPRFIANTTDVLFDITEEPGLVIDWILDTHDDFIDSRYVGSDNRHAESGNLSTVSP